MLALHARRSFASIRAFAERFPTRPLLLTLTGTDLYRDIHEDSDAQLALELAHRIIVLQERGVDELPAHLATKTAWSINRPPTLPTWRRLPTPSRCW